MSSWTAIAGEETAKHSTPVGVVDGVLTVACESTAWSTQLRLMRIEIMNHIAVNHPDAGITAIRFKGPTSRTGKRAPGRFQGVVRAIPTAEDAFSVDPGEIVRQIATERRATGRRAVEWRAAEPQRRPRARDLQIRLRAATDRQRRTPQL